MSTRDDNGVPTSSGIPAIIFACALGLLSAGFLGLFGTVGQGLGGGGSLLTLPKMAIAGGCFGATVAGLVALLCGFHLRRGFCYLSLAAFGATAGMIVTDASMILHSNNRDDPHLLLEDAIALGIMCASFLGGAVVRRFVTWFGPKSRAWAGIGGGISAATVFPLVAVLTYASMKADDAKLQAQYPHLDFSYREYLFDALIGALVAALLAALVGGWIGAVIGAIRDSKVQPMKTPGGPPEGGRG
jgi:hypothetical protein